MLHTSTPFRQATRPRPPVTTGIIPNWARQRLLRYRREQRPELALPSKTGWDIFQTVASEFAIVTDSDHWGRAVFGKEHVLVNEPENDFGHIVFEDFAIEMGWRLELHHKPQLLGPFSYRYEFWMEAAK